jgi:probable phosphoglycerate mutase
MTELIFIRHGETDYNRQLRFQGQVDVPLNATGHEQAARLAKRLAANPVDLLLTSDLQRARQTAAPVAGAWQVSPVLAEAFREQSFGIFEGMTIESIKAQHGELWRHWLEHLADFAIPGGESLAQFHRRVMQGVRELAAAHAGARLAVITHGGVLDMLWRSAHGLPIEGLRRCEIPNTGINRLRWVGDSLVIDSWADAAHLRGMGEQPSTTASER